MLYTGVDIVEIERIEQAVARWGERFLRRVFTPGERRDSGERPRSLAARWAAKEAAAKALGIGLQGFGAAATVGAGNAVRWLDLEVQRAPTGQPTLILHGGAAERAAALGWQSVALSLSHGHEYAIALVVAEGGGVNKRTKNEEQRTKNKEQRTKNKEQRTKNKEQRTKNNRTTEQQNNRTTNNEQQNKEQRTTNNE